MRSIANTSVNSGFTILELILVVAIIGLLATMILVALGASRVRAKNARIVSDVKQVSSQIGGEMLSSGLYSGGVGTANCLSSTANTINPSSVICGTGASGYSTDIATQGGVLTVQTIPNSGINIAYTQYAVYATVAGVTLYCIDSQGGVGTSTPVAATCQ